METEDVQGVGLEQNKVGVCFSGKMCGGVGGGGVHWDGVQM